MIAQTWLVLRLAALCAPALFCGCVCGPASPTYEDDDGLYYDAPDTGFVFDVCEDVDCGDAVCTRWDRRDYACVTPGGAGSRCRNVDYCEAGLTCVDSVCTAHAHEGESCEGAVVCIGNTYCGGAPGSRTCGNLGRVGDACTRSTQCGRLLRCTGFTCRYENPDDECAHATDCEPGGICTNSPDGTRCLMPAAEGEPCGESDRPCGPSLRCVATGDDGPICARQFPEGADCDTTDQCAPPATCSPDRICRIPAQIPGAPCIADHDCHADYACFEGPTGGQCLARGVQGAACTRDAECRDNRICAGTSPGVCVFELHVGGSCNFDHECGGVMRCNAGICGLAGARGTECQTARECNANLECLPNPEECDHLQSVNERQNTDEVVFERDLVAPSLDRNPATLQARDRKRRWTRVETVPCLILAKNLLSL